MKLIIKKNLCEQKWNKDSKTPRDYSKEYNAPGSKEQDDRNKRKRDKRKHDKEQGECPDGEELHHLNGVEKENLECELISKNRGRKEKSRLKKGEIVIKITKSLAESSIDKQPSIDGGGTPVPLDQQGSTKKAQVKRQYHAKKKSPSKDKIGDILAQTLLGQDDDYTSGSSLRAEDKKQFNKNDNS